MRRSRPTRWTGAAALLVAGLVSGAHARGQEGDSTAAAPATIQEEMARLNRSMDAIVRMMGDLLAQQEDDLLLKRLEILQRRLSPAEAELRATREDAASAQEELESLAARAKLIEEQWDEQERTSGQAVPDGERKMMLMEFETRQESVAARAARLTQRLQELEADLAGRRADIADLEAILDERLGLR